MCHLRDTNQKTGTCPHKQILLTKSRCTVNTKQEMLRISMKQIQTFPKTRFQSRENTSGRHATFTWISHLRNHPSGYTTGGHHRPSFSLASSIRLTRFPLSSCPSPFYSLALPLPSLPILTSLNFAPKFLLTQSDAPHSPLEDSQRSLIISILQTPWLLLNSYFCLSATA